jgi:hypothetical protein
MVKHKGAFECWAVSQSYDLALAESDSEIREYADGDTQAAFVAWRAGVTSVALSVSKSLLDRQSFIERILVFIERNAEHVAET